MPLDFLGTADAPADTRPPTLPGPRSGEVTSPTPLPLRVLLDLPPIDRLDEARTVLSAALSLFGPADQLEVALVVAEEVCEDAGVMEQIGALCQSLVDEPAGLPEIVVYGEVEAKALPSLLRVSSAGSARDVAQAVILLTATAQQMWEGQSEAAPQPAPAPAAVRSTATYVGNDRLLVVPQTGGKLFCSASDLSITPDLAAYGVLDLGLTSFLAREIRPGMVCVDVGANIGVFTVLMARLTGPKGKVVAYEINPKVLALLRDNLSINYVNQWVDVRQEAAWSREEELTLHISEVFQGNSSVYEHNEWYRDYFPQDEFRQLTVQAAPLDPVLLAESHVDLVKIDVEGADHHVLAGMRQALSAGRVGTVVFEVARQRLSPEEDARFVALLTSLHSEGWQFSLLQADGELRPLELPALVQITWASSVVLRRD